MGEVKNLFGDVPEPSPAPREASHREVVDATYARIQQNFINTTVPLGTLVAITLEDFCFLLTQLGVARDALKTIEQAGQHALKTEARTTVVFGDPRPQTPTLAWASSTLVFIEESLAFDETAHGLASESMPPEIANDIMPIPLCPGCKKAPAPEWKLPTEPGSAVERARDAVMKMFAAHPFTRKAIVLCAEKYNR